MLLVHMSRSAILHLLYHPGIPERPYLPHFSVTDITWPQILVGFGSAHPYTWHLRRGWRRQYKKKQRACRLRLLSAGQMGEECLSQTFAVAQAEYPTRLFRAFKLEDPPSPYELACFLFTWALPQGEKGASAQWGRSALLWWLAGISGEALAQIYPEWEEGAGREIERLMKTPMFAIWALGTDMIPAIKSPTDARALLSFGPTRRPKVVVRAFESMRASIYVNSHISSGKRGRAAKRWLPEFRPLWHTLDERIEWEEDGRWMPRLMGMREEAARLLKYDKSWIPKPREENILRDSDVTGLYIEENRHPGLPWR